MAIGKPEQCSIVWEARSWLFGGQSSVIQFAQPPATRAMKSEVSSLTSMKEFGPLIVLGWCGGCSCIPPQICRTLSFGRKKHIWIGPQRVYKQIAEVEGCRGRNGSEKCHTRRENCVQAVQSGKCGTWREKGGCKTKVERGKCYIWRQNSVLVLPLRVWAGWLAAQVCRCGLHFRFPVPLDSTWYARCASYVCTPRDQSSLWAGRS